MKKRIVSILLAAAMIIVTLPLSAITAFAEDDTLRIASKDDWDAFAQQVNGGNTFAGKTVVLDCSIGVTKSVGNWDTQKAFSGTFDGKGNSIGFSDYTSSTSNKGVFSYTVDAKISNLKVYGNNEGSYSLGGIAGCAKNTEITNCESSMEIKSFGTGDVAYAGGIVGVSEGGNTISDCKNIGSVSGNYSVGGIIGETRNNDTIKNCVNSCASVSGNNNIGGIVGNCKYNATVLNCINESEVSGSKYIGGIIGRTNTDPVAIENCINYGNITVNERGNFSGGIVGLKSGSVAIKNCFSAGEVSDDGDHGMIVGWDALGDFSLENCAYLLLDADSGMILVGNNDTDFSEEVMVAETKTDPEMLAAMNERSAENDGWLYWTVSDDKAWLTADDPDEVITVTEKTPTCNEGGWQQHYKLGNTLYEDMECTVEIPDITLWSGYIPATGIHTPVTDAAKEPTCGETGLSEGSHCSVCNTILTAQNIIPATGIHTWINCSETKHKCTVCGATDDHTLDDDGACAVCGRTNKYIVRSWDETNKTVKISENDIPEDAIKITSDMTDLYSGLYVVTEDVTVSRITAHGTASAPTGIVLIDGCTLTSQGITVALENVLDIYGQSGDTGSLIARSDIYRVAGIGGEANGTCGTVNIFGGNVTAEGGGRGAGIGGGENGKGGTVNIYAGTVTAKGGDIASGIGGGGEGDGGTTNIYGGNVTAIGGEDCGAGIGGGMLHSGGTTNIYNGTVTAKGGGLAAGIGGGNTGSGDTTNIYGGNVTAEAGYSGGGAGIGGGSGWGMDQGRGGTINISGGNVIAIGSMDGGAGIGGGLYAVGGTINISGGNVTATGNGGGAGIGGGCGQAYKNIGSGGNVTISGGKVTAQSNGGGAGIGGGKDALDHKELSIFEYAVVKAGSTAPGEETTIAGYIGSRDAYVNIASGFSYKVNGTTVTAKYPGTDLQASMTLVLPEAPVYDGNEKAATLEGLDDFVALTNAEVGTVLYSSDGIGFSANAPVNAGTYYVKVTVEDTALTARFTVEKATPTASDFTFIPPEDCGHDFQPKYAAVFTEKQGMGNIALKYQKQNGDLWDEILTDAPVDPGNYKVTVIIGEGENYNASYGITSNDWVFEIYAHENTEIIYAWNGTHTKCTATLHCYDCSKDILTEESTDITFGETQKASDCRHYDQIPVTVVFEKLGTVDTFIDGEPGPHINTVVSYMWDGAHTKCTAASHCNDCNKDIPTEESTDITFGETQKASDCRHYDQISVTVVFEKLGTVDLVIDGEPGPHIFENYKCKFCPAEDTATARQDATAAFDEAESSSDAVISLLATAAKTAIEKAEKLFDILQLWNYWSTAIDKQTGDIHEHTYSENWSCDTYYHWHDSVCEHGGLTSDFGAHSWDGGEKVGDKIRYTCTVCGFSKTVQAPLPDTETEPVSDEVKYTGISLTLGSDIYMNFYMQLSEEALASGTMAFAVGGRTVDGITLRTNGKGVYFACPLTALQLSEDVTASFTYGNITYTQTYSVERYIETILYGKDESGKPFTDEMKLLARKIANYGHYAQTYLAGLHKSIVLGEGGYARTEKFGGDYDVDTAAAKAALSDTFVAPEKAGGIGFYGRSVYLESAIALNFYVTVDSGEMPTAFCEGKDVTVEMYNKNIYIVSIKGITATELGTAFTVTVGKTDDFAGVDFTGSVLDYCAAVIAAHSVGTADDDAVCAMAAFYEYYAAAVAYAEAKGE